MLRQPGMAGRAVLVAILVIVLVPLAVIFVAAMLIVAVIAGAMIACQRAVRRLRTRGWLPRRDGRENVRVVTRQAS